MLNPQKKFGAFAGVLGLFVATAPIVAQAQGSPTPTSPPIAATVTASPFPTEFQLPATLAGRWFFKNTQTGQEYGGAVKVVLASKVNREVDVQSYDGTFSFDGSQRDSRCGTQGIFSGDTPVPLQWDAKGETVKLTYKFACEQSRKVVDYKVFGAELKKFDSVPHGKGETVLRLVPAN